MRSEMKNKEEEGEGKGGEWLDEGEEEKGKKL